MTSARWRSPTSRAGVVAIVAGLCLAFSPAVATATLMAIGVLVGLRRRVSTGGWWLLVPAEYLAAALVLGLLAGGTLAERLGRPALPAWQPSVAYLSVLCAAYATAAVLPRPNRVSRTTVRTQAQRALRSLKFTWALATVIGLIGASQLLGGVDLSALVEDPLTSRRVIVESAPSPFAWLAFRSLIVAAAAASAVVAITIRRRRTAAAVLVVANLPYALVMSGYGGRLLPLTVFGNALLVFSFLSTPPRPRNVVLVGATSYLLTSWYAAYRYFSFFGETVTMERYSTTLLAQAAGEFTDAQRVGSRVRGERPLWETLRDELLDSLPDQFAQAFDGSATGPVLTVGERASRLLNESHVGGIRIGATNEAFFALGVPGTLLLGCTLGAALWFANRQMTRGDVVIAALVITQAATTLILGVTSLVNAVPLVVAAAALLHSVELGSSKSASADVTPKPAPEPKAWP